MTARPAASYRANGRLPQQTERRRDQHMAGYKPKPPSNGRAECARRVRQIASGFLTAGSRGAAA